MNDALKLVPSRSSQQSRRQRTKALRRRNKRRIFEHLESRVVLSANSLLSSQSDFEAETTTNDFGQYAMESSQVASMVTRFAMLGDFGDNSAAEANVAAMVAAQNPDFIVTAGDNRYGTQSYQQTVADHYGAFVPPVSGGTSLENRFFPSPGNHDYYDGGGINEYLTYFELPGFGAVSTNSSGNERYYDVIEGDVHLFFIDSEAAITSAADMAEQQAWLQTQLGGSTTAWQVVILHHAPYSSGNHGSNLTMQWDYANWGADAVMAGHDHTYERIAQNGIPFFVNGLGGRSIYSFGTPIQGSEFRYNADYGAMLVEASPDSMTFSFLDTLGTVIDSHTIGVTTPPPESGIVERQISQSSDDAEERASDGVIDLTSSDIELGDDPGFNEDQTAGLRFQNITVPQGATITNAYLEFETDETDAVATTITIRAQAADSASTFSSVVNDLTSRPTTSASVAWTLPAWDIIDAKHQSPDLSSLVKEVVDRSGWNPGNSIVFLTEGTGSRTAESYDGEALAAAKLHIEYSSGSGSSLTAHWRLDEANGTLVADATGNGNTGTFNGTPTWGSGPLGGGLEFDGSGEFVSLANPIQISGDWTFATWVRPSDAGASSMLAGGPSTALKLEQWNDTGKVGFTEFGAADYSFNYSPPSDQWVHLAFVKTASGIDLYANGTLVDSNPNGIALDVTTLGGGDPLKGMLDDVRVYQGALLGSEVASLFNSSSNLPPVATDDYASTAQNNPVVLSVLGNDGDSDGDVLSLASFTQPSNGVVTDNGNGTLTYAPNGGYLGTDTFAYTVGDGNGGTDVAEVAVTVADSSARTLEFSGLQWTVKASGESPVGPGPNYFGNTTDDVWVDANGHLHLKISARDGKWYSSEIISNDIVGHGTYTFTLGSRIDQLDPNIVVGLFTWDTYAPEHAYREVDIEFSRWGDPLYYNSSYTVQPYTTAGNTHSWETTLAGTDSTHSFAWYPNRVDFSSYQGDPAGDPIQSWTYTGADIPPEGTAGAGANARINFWLFGGAPSDGQEAELVVKSFDFTPWNGNNTPVAVDDSVTTNRNTPVLITPLINDSDPNGDSLNITGIDGVDNGTVTNDANILTFTPAVGFTGTEVFTYTISNAAGGTDIGTITVDVIADGGPQVMSWVPPYAIAASQSAVQADFGAYDAVDGLTRVGLQFWVPQADGSLAYQDDYQLLTDADVAWWTDWGDTNGIETLLTVYNGIDGQWNWDIARSAFANNRTTFVNALVNEMDRLNLDGIDLDLEGIGDFSADRAAFNQFVQELAVQIDARGKILTVDSFAYIWNAPNQDWWSDWVGQVDAIHVMGYEQTYEGGTSWEKYSFQQNVGLSAGYNANQIIMGMPGWLDSWGTSSGRGTSALAHVQEAKYDLAEPAGVAIWDLQLSASAWRDPNLWQELASLQGGTGNTAPNANADSAFTGIDTPITISVLANDSDAENDPLTIDSFTQGSNGTVSNNGDGTLTYTPAVGFVGSDQFTYTITDGKSGFDTATVTIVVQDPSSAPSPNPMTFAVLPYLNTTWPDSNVVTMVATTASDPDGGIEYFFDSIEAAEGTWWNGAEDSGWLTSSTFSDWYLQEGFTYHYRVKARDALGNETGWSPVAQIVLGGVNQAPVAVDDASTTTEGSSVVIPVLANDTDADGDTLSISSWTQPTAGSVVNNGDGTLTYQPDPGFVGVDSFSYTVSDGNGGTDNGNVNITVNAQVPAARPFPQHTTYAAGVILPNHRSQTQLDQDVRNFYDAWSSNYVVSAGTNAQGVELYRVKFGSNEPDQTVSEGQGFGMIITAMMAGHDPNAKDVFDGLWAFSRENPSSGDPRLMDWKVPQTGGDNSAFDGDADIAYGLLLADAQWGSQGSVNYSAAASSVIAGILESTVGPESFLPMLGDWVNPNGSPHNQYTPRSSDFLPAHFRAYGAHTGNPVWNQVIANSQSVIESVQNTYSPSTGLLPDFIVSADSNPQPAGGNFLEGPNDGAYYYNAGRDPLRIGIDAILNGDVASTNQVQRMADWIISSTGGNALNIKGGYQLDGTVIGNYFTTFFAAPFGVAAMADSNDQAFLNSVYDAVYNRYEDYYEDSVNLLALLVMSGNYWDPYGGQYNAPPAAIDDLATTNEDVPVQISVLANDSDPDGNAISIASFTQPANGAVTDNADGTLTYSPNNNFYGSDSFSYTISDGNGGSDSATVSVTVNPVNDAPIAVNDSAATDQNQPVTVAVLSNDTDLDGDALTVVSITQGANGTVINNGDGTLTYTPNTDFSGSDSFSYVVDDGNGATDTAQVDVTVEAPPQVFQYFDIAASTANIAGTSNGNVTDTHFRDGLYQSIREELYQKNSRSRLEQHWVFDVTGGDVGVSFHARLGHDSTAETFRFDYSIGSGWEPLFTLNSNTMSDYAVVLPSTVNGTVTVRVIDTNRSRGESSVDTVQVEEMYFLSERSTALPPRISVSVTDSTASEAGPNAGEFTFSLADGITQTNDLSVFFTVTGSATSDDYVETLGNSVVIPRGQLSVTVPITPVDDLIQEPVEDVIITLNPDSTYILTPANSAAVTIADNDTTEFFATGEASIYGTADSSFENTHADDGVYQTLTEERYSGGSKKSRLEHRWSFDLTGQSSLNFVLEAEHLTPNDRDNFDFSYSIDGGATWIYLLSVTTSTNAIQSKSISLPAGASQVIVRVTDTDSSNDRSSGALRIDRMMFQIPSSSTAAVDEAMGGFPW